MPRVFTVGALMPTGGAFMAYHLGRLLHRNFGYGFFNVSASRADRKVFHYDTPVETVSIAEMERMITGDDLLVVNPSYSQFLFGLRLPGRKIMYIQDFRTFMLLDCHCDLYVSVSSTVQRYIQAVYGIATPVIPAFVDHDRMPPVVPWDLRPPASALVYMKHASHEHRVLYEGLVKKLSIIAPRVNLSRLLEGRGLSHADFMKQLGSARYFVNMSLAEGFGLVPLEAMAMGSMVTGVDGLAGADYMTPGKDCLVGSVRNLRPLPEIIRDAFADEARARAIAAEGYKTARRYGYEPFRAAWLKQFSSFLGREPADA